MLPDRVSNPGPLTYESGAYRLRYAARRVGAGAGSFGRGSGFFFTIYWGGGQK